MNGVNIDDWSLIWKICLLLKYQQVAYEVYSYFLDLPTILFAFAHQK